MATREDILRAAAEDAKKDNPVAKPAAKPGKTLSPAEAARVDAAKDTAKDAPRARPAPSIIREAASELNKPTLSPLHPASAVDQDTRDAFIRFRARTTAEANGANPIGARYVAEMAARRAGASPQPIAPPTSTAAGKALRDASIQQAATAKSENYALAPAAQSGSRAPAAVGNVIAAAQSMPIAAPLVKGHVVDTALRDVPGQSLIGRRISELAGRMLLHQSVAEGAQPGLSLTDRGEIVAEPVGNEYVKEVAYNLGGLQTGTMKGLTFGALDALPKQGVGGAVRKAIRLDEAGSPVFSDVGHEIGAFLAMEGIGGVAGKLVESTMPEVRAALKSVGGLGKNGEGLTRAVEQGLLTEKQAATFLANVHRAKTLGIGTAMYGASEITHPSQSPGEALARAAVTIPSLAAAGLGAGALRGLANRIPMTSGTAATVGKTVNVAEMEGLNAINALSGAIAGQGSFGDLYAQGALPMILYGVLTPSAVTGRATPRVAPAIPEVSKSTAERPPLMRPTTEPFTPRPVVKSAGASQVMVPGAAPKVMVGEAIVGQVQVQAPVAPSTAVEQPLRRGDMVYYTDPKTGKEVIGRLIDSAPTTTKGKRGKPATQSWRVDTQVTGRMSDEHVDDYGLIVSADPSTVRRVPADGTTLTLTPTPEQADVVASGKVKKSGFSTAQEQYAGEKIVEAKAALESGDALRVEIPIPGDGKFTVGSTGQAENLYKRIVGKDMPDVSPAAPTVSPAQPSTLVTPEPARVREGQEGTPKFDSDSNALLRQFKKYAGDKGMEYNEQRIYDTAKAIAELNRDVSYEGAEPKIADVAEAIQYEQTGGIEKMLATGTWDDGSPLNSLPPIASRLRDVAIKMGLAIPDNLLRMTREEWLKVLQEYYRYQPDTAVRMLERDVKGLKGEIVPSAPIESVPDATPPTRLRATADELRAASDALWQDIAKDMGRLNAGIDPILVGKITAYGALKIAEGVVRFADWSAHMVERAGEEIRPYLQEIWDKAQAVSEDDVRDILRGMAFPTSNRRAVVNVERAMRGLDQFTAPDRKAWQTAMDNAAARMENDPFYADRLITDLTDDPRPMNDEEVAALLLQRVEANNQMVAASAELKDAVAAGDPVAEHDAKARLDAALTRLDSIETVYKPGGAVTETARGLAAVAMAAREDFSLERMVIRKRQANGWRALTENERAELQKQADEYQRIVAELEQRNAEKDARIAELESQQAHKDVLREVVKEQRKAKRAKKAKTDDKRAAERKATIEALRAKVGAKADAASIGNLIQRLAKQHVENGVRERDALIDAVHADIKDILPDMTRRDVMDAISGYGQYRQLSKDEVSQALRDLKGQLQQIGKLEDMAAGNAPKKTGTERRVPSDEERRLIKQVEEAKRKGGYKVTDPATQLASALQARKTYYRNRMADLQYEIATGTRIVKGAAKQIADTELSALKTEYQRVKAEHDAIFKQGMTDAQKLKMALAAAERNLAAWQQRLANAKRGVFGVDKKAPMTSPEIAALKAEAEAVKAEVAALKELANPKPSPEAVRDARYQAALLRQIAEYERRMSERDYAPKTRREPPTDQKTLELIVQRERVKMRFYEEVLNDKLRNLTPLQKALGIAEEAYHFQRAVLTSFDVSAPGRQGAMAIFSHPVTAAKAYWPMLKAFWSKHQHDLGIAAIQNSPNYGLYKRAKLALIEEGASLSAQEENYRSRWAKKVPIVSGSERAYITFLNKMRADVFDLLIGADGRNMSTDELRDVAKLVNAMTGRGTLWKAEQAATVLNEFIFSPRLQTSRLQYLFWEPAWNSKSARGRRVAVKEIARSWLGAATTLTAFAILGAGMGFTIELDPKDSDFLVVRRGNARYDILGGMKQWIVFLTRLFSGKTTTGAGEVRALRGDDVRYGQRDGKDLLYDFVRSKAAPVPGLVMDALVTGKHYGGEKVTPLTGLRNLVVPISIQQGLDLVQKEGAKEGLIDTAIGMTGIGVSNYSDGTGTDRTRATRKRQLRLRDTRDLSRPIQPPGAR